MGITASGLFTNVFKAILDATQLAVDLSLTTHKLAIYPNTITPDFDATLANAAYGAGQYTTDLYGGSWAQGGVALSAAASGGTSTAPAVTVVSGSIMYDMADIAVASTTFSSGRAALLYADALAGNNAIVLVNFGADYSPNGLFEIQWPANGVFQIDLTP
jgi:hypothetical protein